MAAVAVDDLEGRAIRAGEVAVAPLEEGDEDGVELQALNGEAVLVAVRPFLVAVAAEDAVFDERLEAVGEDVAGDRQAGGEVLEATDAVEGVAEDE